MTNIQLQHLADDLFSLLSTKRLTICTAESITAGYICGTIAKASGISRWLKGGLVCYQPAVKTDILKIPQDLVTLRYAVNEPTAIRMAENAAALFGADIAISSTGFAESYENYWPEAYVGIYLAQSGVSVIHLDLRETTRREEVRLAVVREGLIGLIERLKGSR
ncbi:MAG: nicotinamide-nucleotide amidohydrolase family protein [Candidatus Schekmanbacteria bacterium]|nr:nicotinamide-nucleotide amidohydrolase family protein [Candidatus Schekmanbacteria bacterium]